MKKLFLLLVVSVFASTGSFAQNKFWNSKDAYLGQKPPGDQPEVFAEKLLVKKDTTPNDRVAFSPDGKEFYYVSSNVWYNTKNTRIRYYKFIHGRWNGPFVLNAHYYDPTFSLDGSKLYFAGDIPGNKSNLTFQSKRKADGSWTEPAVFLSTSYPLYDLIPTNKGTWYAGSTVYADISRKDMDISEFKMLPGDTTVKSLGEPLNTKEYEGDFFIDKEESYIILSTKETNGGECELWISFHQTDGKWTAPVSLGANINNGPAHRWGEYVSPNGKFLFYSWGHGAADCRIVWVRFDHLLAQLKKQVLGPAANHQ